MVNFHTGFKSGMVARDLPIYFKLFALPWLAACSHFTYYYQAIEGHLDLMSRRERIETILTNPARDTDLLQKLTLANEIRDFASQSLALPDNGSYRTYVDAGRQYVTWSVYATAEFSLQPKNWCFPVAGCVPYRGYFTELEAKKFARELREGGMDVYVIGISAYSTLGWFDDPLLNTMIQRGEMAMAGIIFHELAHQRIYVKGDTAFNEAFAVAVQEAGVRRWLRQRRTQDDLKLFENTLQHKLDFYALIEKTRRRLRVVYASNINEGAMRAAKHRIIGSLTQAYQRLKKNWGGYSGYDRWFNEPINNAKLAAVAIYRDHVPAFHRLLKACGENFDHFYTKVEQISKLSHTKRQQLVGWSEDCSVHSAPL